MIICPDCNEEIDDDSRYCDQCGRALLYCEQCGRVGIGRRCTHCGGMMYSLDDIEKKTNSDDTSLSSAFRSFTASIAVSRRGSVEMPQQAKVLGAPQLTLYNGNLNIRIIGQNGAIIGRRQGIYQKMFENNKYVSGVHAQLMYNGGTGWSIVDKHSSNGTMVNQHPLKPDVAMSINNGDIVTIANINLQVSVI